MKNIARPDGMDMNKVLLTIGSDQELLFYTLGLTTADPPNLCDAKHDPGASAYRAVESLLDRIEQRHSDCRYIRALLCGFHEDMIAPVALINIHCLSQDSKADALELLQWVANAGGLRGEDFRDGGARFMRLALRKHPQKPNIGSL